MDIKYYRDILSDIIRKYLYESSNIEYNLDDIINFLNSNNNYINDLKVLVSGRNNENYFCYDKFINQIISKSSFDIRLEILNNQDDFKDIILFKDSYISLWDTFTKSEKIAYLRDKRKYSDIDIILINDLISDDINSFFTIYKDINIVKRIDSFSINIDLLDYIDQVDLSNYDSIRILNKYSYTTLLVSKYSNDFNGFKDLVISNKSIINLIDNNSLVFNDSYNKDIYSFIKDNINYIGKFNIKYLDLFSIIEINDMKNNKNIDSYSYSIIMQRLYKYDNNASIYFNSDTLRNYSKHSISINPFDKLDDVNRNIIFNDYNLFNKFIDTIMIEAMSEYSDEDIILNMLRDDNFVNDISSFAMELLLNKLSFKASFNMLQRKNILNKVNHLNININDNDLVFIKTFIDSPSLVNKSDHNMIFDMLIRLNKDDTWYYITLPYILNVLGNKEVVDICLYKNININDIINSKSIMEKLSVNDIIYYIDSSFKSNVDLSIFKDKELCKLLFNLSDKNINDINIDEVNYLVESIRTKSMLSKQDNSITVQSYKSILCSYLVLGLDDTLKIVSDGNKNINLDDIKLLKENIINEKILLYKRDNSSLFQNMIHNVIRELKQVGYDDNIDIFEQKVRRNTYLDNIIYLMLDNNYDSYNNIVLKLYNYLKYCNYNEYDSKVELFDYIKNFNSMLIKNIENDYNKYFDNIILKNSTLKENVIYKERKRIGKEYLNKKKFKVFINSLTDNNDYSYYYKDNYDYKNVLNDYIKYIGKDIEFDNLLEHVLYPISNDRFDNINCLNKLGINKPDNYDDYYNYLNDLDNLSKLNDKLNQYKYMFTIEEFLSIMNYICYGNSIDFKIKTKVKNVFKKLNILCNSIKGEVYIDKSTMNFIYKDNIDIYNIEEIIEYNKYLKILDDIINKTYKFINKYMDDKKIMLLYSSDYFNHININNTYPITNRYYETKKRVLSINDIEKMFNGYNLIKYKKINSSLYKFLFDKKNLIMYLDGYYDGIVDNFGLIISRWNSIVSYANKLDILEDDLTLIKVENILTLMDYDNDMFIKSINKDIIKSIYDDGYYEVFDLNKRVKMLSNLYKESYKKVSLSIPYVEVNDEDYTIKVIDKYSMDMFRYSNDSIYKIGMIGNDLLHYSILSDLGFKIGIYKNNELVCSTIGIRNGNVVYLNKLEGIKIDNIESLLNKFGNKLIDDTKDDLEKIEFVTIVNNDLYSSSNGIKIDSSICEIISNPINMDDYESFKDYKYLINDMYTNYNNGVTTLVASSTVVDRSNIKYYVPKSKYFRKRNNVIKLSNNIGEEYLNKIDNILLLAKEIDDSINIDNISLSIIDTIFLGDDFVILITEKNNIVKYILNYDDRSYNEVDLVIQSIN